MSFVTCYVQGGLGNQLFIIFTTICVAITQKLKYIIEQYSGCNIKMYNLSLKKLKKISAKNSASFLLGYPLGVKNRKITVLRKKHIYKLILKYTEYPDMI